MKSLNGVGLGLSLVFGCLLLALLAELCYLLWWKKRFSKTGNGNAYNYPAKMLCKMCLEKPFSATPNAPNSQQFCPSEAIVSQHQDINPNKDLWPQDTMVEDSTMDDCTVFNRALFTIAEETGEDLESAGNSRKQSRSKSLSDLIQTVETPFLSPLASSPYFTPPDLTPNNQTEPCKSEPDFNFWGLSDSSSPPPKFKFLRDAEEKLQRQVRIMEELTAEKEKKDGSSVKIIVEKNRGEEEEETELNLSRYSSNVSSSLQVLPLNSPPPLKPMLLLPSKQQN